jgi:hypothetical protein
MLLQTTESYSGCQKILLRQTLSWDCPFNSRKSKTFNLGIKVLENMIRAYCTLKADRQYTPKYPMRDAETA